MALGGGTFLTQNKVLPGTYHNFMSATKAFANLSERGYVALPDVFGWFDEGVHTLKLEQIQHESLKLTGYQYDHEKLKPLREIFKNAHTVFIYAVNEGAVAATNTFATALKKGVRGNDLKIVIAANVDESSKFDVSTYIDTTIVDVQTVANASELVANDFVKFKSDAELAPTASTPLTGGSNGTTPTATTWQNALDEFEAYGFNTLICPTTDKSIKDLFIAYTKRMRDEVGAKFQLVGYKLGATDHEGIIDVHNKATELEYGLVYWSAGASAGCAVNKSNTNKQYDGEYTVDFTGAKTQYELSNLLKSGKFVFHRVGEETRVLDDVNTFTSFSEEKNEDFSMNQVVRVLDQDCIDMAHLFNNRYLGKVPNDQSGRMSLWSDVVTHGRELEKLRAIESFNPDSVTVEQGQSKKSVVIHKELSVTVAMSQLYITTVVA